MSKIKTLTSLFLGAAVYLYGAVSVSAAVLSIQQLPAYLNTNNFKLSCTSDGGVVQFSVSKNGGGFTNFGPSIDTDSNPCLVQVDSSAVNDQGNYTFSVGGKTTSTVYDNVGPNTVSGYYKDGLGDGYKLHWRNPNDSDFSKVIIYRGESGDFTADSSHEIATITGGADSDMTYEDHGVDPNKTYFYNIRAVDKAGNGSGLVGDGGGTTTVYTTPSSTSEGSVTTFPREQGTGGSVLGTEASPTPESTVEPAKAGVVDQINQFAGKTPEPFKWILTHKKIAIGIAVILGLLAYNFYKASKRK